jgi:hypothetical protein
MQRARLRPAIQQYEVNHEKRASALSFAISAKEPLTMRSKPLAFIFDIDGTLVDSNELHVDSWDRSFRHFGKQFPREALRAQIGKGSDQ